MTVLAILNSLIFIALALLHIYWVFGGTIFMNAVLPETEGNKKLFSKIKSGKLFGCKPMVF